MALTSTDAHNRIVAALARCDTPPLPREVVTDLGTSTVFSWDAVGADSGADVVMIAGFGATPLSWAPCAQLLGRAGRRAHVITLPGDVGAVPITGDRPRRTADLVAWLTQVTERLVGDRFDVAGHSYGGWVALQHALARPEAVERLVLVDPTSCFVGMSPWYVIRSIPVLIRPSRERYRRFVAWETRGRFDSGWADVAGSAAASPSSLYVPPRRPSPELLGTLRVPTTVVVAGASRAHRPDLLAERASAWEAVRVVGLPDLGHHSVPALAADVLARIISG